MYRYVGNRPEAFVDVLGLQSAMNAQPQTEVSPAAMRRWQAEAGASWIADFWNEAGAGLGKMVSKYQQLLKANTIGIDKYFHCKANCEAAREGLGGEFAAQVISDLREVFGYSKGDPLMDILGDLAANIAGRCAAPGLSCHDRCRPLLPASLPKGFPR